MAELKRVKWNKHALTNLQEKANYFEAEYSKQVAERFVKKVFGRIDVLLEHPTIGRKVPK